MTTRASIKHTFEVDEDTYWNKIFFNEDFNRTLYKDRLGFRVYDLVESSTRPDGTRLRVVKNEPDIEAPGAIQKLVGGSVGYFERGEWSPTTRRYRFSIEPTKMADKVTVTGEFWVEPRGDRRVERICELNIECRVFGVGKLVENFLEESTRKSHEYAARFTNEFVKENGL